MPLSGDIKEHKYMYKDVCTRGGADDVYKYDFYYNILVFSRTQAHPHSSTIILGTSRFTMLYSSSKYSMDMVLSLVGIQQEFMDPGLMPRMRYWFTTAVWKDEAEPGTPAMYAGQFPSQ